MTQTRYHLMTSWDYALADDGAPAIGGDGDPDVYVTLCGEYLPRPFVTPYAYHADCPECLRRLPSPIKGLAIPIEDWEERMRLLTGCELCQLVSQTATIIFNRINHGQIRPNEWADLKKFFDQWHEHLADPNPVEYGTFGTHRA